MSIDNRQYERIDIELSCRMFIEDAGELMFEAFCKTGNLCLGGVFLETETLLREGIRITVELALPEDALAVDGVVVHRVAHEGGELTTGLGIEFQDVDENARETLLRYFTPERYTHFYETMLNEFPHIVDELQIPQVSLVLNLWEEWKVRQAGGPAATAAGAPPATKRRKR
jgi:hypothetical protein